MNCDRCHSPMVHQKFYDPQGQFWGWRCVLCGDIVDPLILENRHVSRISGSPKNGRFKGGNRVRSYTTNKIYQVKITTGPLSNAVSSKPGCSPPLPNELPVKDV